MAIQSGKPTGVIDIGVTDTILLHPVTPLTRVNITAFSLHSVDGVAQTVEVEVFVSPDATSASGERVAVIKVGVDNSEPVREMIGESILGDTQWLIAKADVVGVNANLTITEYEGDS